MTELNGTVASRITCQEMDDIVARDARALRFSGVEQAKL
jgi:hypothetical protein